ncbi:MAG: iron chelate uptake ABC transporter family permease subunit [Planctomycetota bacterium]
MAPRTVYGLGGLALAGALLLSLSVGVIAVPFGEVLAALTGGADAGLHRTLIVDMRLPRAIGALLVGAGLGTSGCILQAILRDPLASPTLIGTAQASGFGRVLGVFLGLPLLGSIGLSFLMAVLSTAIVLLLSCSRRGLPAQPCCSPGSTAGVDFVL